MAFLEEQSFTHHVDQTTFYLSGGPVSGPLIIFCHGWPATGKTWKAQLGFFATLGYRVIAPDMPGYGQSSAPKDFSNYPLESVNGTMLSLLEHIERDSAVWIGHDWGAVAVWSFAAHYPEKTKAVCCLARPYHTLEYGLEEVLSTVNRTIFPTETFPYAQYDYQVYFQQSFEKATSWFEKDIEGVIRAIYLRGNPNEVGKPGLTATVTKAGGWFGGAPEPPARLRHIPIQAICIDEDMYQEIVESMKTTGFWGANAWYMNHEANRKYSLEKRKHDGYLRMPVLFIGANWDAISDVTVSSIAEKQKVYCQNLKEVYLDAGHWVGLERSQEVNEAIASWLKENILEV